MAFLLPLNQPISFTETEHVQRVKTNAVNTVDDMYFKHGDASWQVINGTITSEDPGNFTLESASNTVRIQQTVFLCAGDHHISLNWTATDAITGFTIKVEPIVTGVLAVTVGEHESDHSFTIPSDGEYLIDIEATYGSNGQEIIFHKMRLWDDTEADVISFQVELCTKGSNLLDDTITFDYTPVFTASDASYVNWAHFGVGSSYTDSDYLVFDNLQLIPASGKHKLHLEFDYFLLLYSRCDMTYIGGEITNTKALGQYTFGASAQTIEFCIDQNQYIDGNPFFESDDQIADLEVNDYIDLGIYGLAEDDGTGTYNLKIEWQDVWVDVIPLFMDDTVALSVGYYRLCFDIPNAEEVTVSIFRVSTGTLVYEKVSELGKFCEIIQIANADDYRVRFQIGSQVDGMELTNVSLYEVCQPAVNLVDNEDDQVVGVFTPTYATVAEDTGNSVVSNVLFNIDLEGYQNGCYRLELYDSDEVTPIYYPSNLFQLSRNVSDLIKVEWTNPANISTGGHIIDWENLTGYAPFMRLPAEVINPTVEDVRNNYEFDTGFVETTFVKNRTLRTIQLLQFQPEYILLAIATAFASDSVLIDEIEYQKIGSDEISPAWPAKGDRKAPLRMQIHKVGEHQINRI